jgi:hypothetical protein
VYIALSAVCFGRDRRLREETPRPYVPRQRDAGAEDDDDGRWGRAGGGSGRQNPGNVARGDHTPGDRTCHMTSLPRRKGESKAGALVIMQTGLSTPLRLRHDPNSATARNQINGAACFPRTGRWDAVPVIRCFTTTPRRFFMPLLHTWHMTSVLE